MKALRIKLYQELACYRKPFTFKAGETYPLPPPSTVKGFFHRLLEAKEYIPMIFSIQGTYSGTTSNLQTTYRFGTVRKEKGKERNYLATFGKTAINSNVFYVNLLVDVNLLIHIYTDEKTLEKLEQALKSPKEYPSLGRWEDIARIDEISIVTLQKVQDDRNGIPMKMPAYVPKDFASKNGLTGIVYQLNDCYEIEHEFRKWNKIEMMYVETGKIYSEVWIDEEDYPVFWHKSYEYSGSSLC